jgi:hypothetical protein
MVDGRIYTFDEIGRAVNITRLVTVPGNHMSAGGYGICVEDVNVLDSGW